MTKQIMVGSVPVGGGAAVSIQSMCNTKTHDVPATVDQIHHLEAAGCEIVRVAVPDMAAAKAIGAIKSRIHVPLVADIHFDYRLALECAAQGIDKIRINPGNIGGEDRVKAVADACREGRIPIRIGVNGGSLEKELLKKYGGATPEALVESALGHAALLEKFDFTDICISVKCSSVPVTMGAYRRAAVSGCGGYPPGDPDGGPGGGGLCREKDSSGRRAAAGGTEYHRLSHLRSDQYRPHPHGGGGGAPSGGLHKAHYRGGDGLRGERTRRGFRRRRGHRRRKWGGAPVPQGGDPPEGASGQAGGRPAGGDCQIVIESFFKSGEQFHYLSV